MHSSAPVPHNEMGHLLYLVLHCSLASSLEVVGYFINASKKSVYLTIFINFQRINLAKF